MPGSAARVCVAELCRSRFGRADSGELERAVLGFFDGCEDLLDRKGEQGTHEGPYGIAPYSFSFGHLYAARAIEALPEVRHVVLGPRMSDLLAQTREPDGSWKDRVFPRSRACGTAAAVLALCALE